MHVEWRGNFYNIFPQIVFRSVDMSKEREIFCELIWKGFGVEPQFRPLILWGLTIISTFQPFFSHHRIKRLINSVRAFEILIIDVQHPLQLPAISSLCFSPRCRSLNMDCENQEKDKDGNPTTTGAFNNSNTNNSECYMSEWNIKTHFTTIHSFLCNF